MRWRCVGPTGPGSGLYQHRRGRTGPARSRSAWRSRIAGLLAFRDGSGRGEDREAADGLDLHVPEGLAKDLADACFRVVQVVEGAPAVEGRQERLTQASVAGGPAEDGRTEERGVGCEHRGDVRDRGR